MSTTIRITSLPILTTPDANTQNTVFVVVDKSSGTFTTKQVSLAAIDLAVDNVAPVAFAVSNLAYGKANSANILAQAAFDKANTTNIFTQSAYTMANSANILAQG